ncbi:MAG TPA: EAL domain-containing protein [Azospirillaceae bacterium]|nr:EAL domain-containing protein [Azospirillaceae bacterium]HRQ80279.1 EAL domain-containing protein [Azospirillaceae bacterium]
MAFQPIIDADSGRVFAHEALVRGVNGEGAGWVLGQVNDDNRYAFDQTCRVKAIETAAALGVECRLSVNFLPNAVYQPETCIRATLDAARRTGFPIDRILFEVTEAEKVDDVGHLRRIIAEYKRQGFTTAIDDFGAGFSGLNLLADYQPDFIKIDMLLTRGIDQDKVRRALLSGIVGACREIGVGVVAEGIETEGEAATLRDMGVNLLQGYLFAKPAFMALAQPAGFAPA